MAETSKIADFMRSMLARDDVGPTKLRKLVVSHIVRGNKVGDEILTISVPDAPTTDWLEDKATRIVEQAAAEALTLGSGLQRYAVHAFFDAEDRSRGRYVFACAGQDEGDDETISTEGPDAEGVTSMAMRHAEVFAQLGSRGSMHQLRALLEDNRELRRDIKDLNKEIREMHAERSKGLRLMEDLQTAKMERDLKINRERMKDRILDDAAEKVTLILPMVINHLAGRKIFPESAAHVLALKSFGESLKAEDFEALRSVLKPEKYGLLVSTLTSVSKTADEVPGAAGADAPNSLATVSPATVAKNGAG